MKSKNNFLLTAAALSFTAAVLHIAIIFGGPDWYRFFGAGEAMAQMAAQGDNEATLITLFIAAVLATWGLYSLSGAKLIIRLPFLKTCLILISSVYTIRGIYGFFLPYISNHPNVQSAGLSFWLWSSTICLSIGIVNFIGVKKAWNTL